MRLFKIIICATFFISFSSANASETRDDRNKFYLGINGGSYLEMIDKEDGLGGSFQIGYDLHKFIAVESQLGIAYASLDESSGGNTLSIQSTAYYGSIYLRGNVRFDTFTLFAIGGYTYLRSDVELTSNIAFLNIDDSENFDDMSYGAGIDLYGNDTTALSFKWIRIIDLGDEGELDTWMLGFTHYLKN
ncbi:outer membrane beta-barrel protein [Kaarinaea lacus]